MMSFRYFAHSLIAVFSLWLPYTVQTADASFVEYTDEAAWNAAVPRVTTIQFTEVPLYSNITDQYSPLGVVFTPGDDWTDFNPSLWASDGVGLQGSILPNGDAQTIIMEFLNPVTSVATRYPTVTRFIIFSDGVQIGLTDLFVGFDPASFAGIVSDVPFDKIIITNTVVSENSIDTLYFGTPVPTPGGVAVIALISAVCGTRRRKA